MNEADRQAYRDLNTEQWCARNDLPPALLDKRRRAKALLRTSAAQGLGGAQVQLAHILRTGEGDDQDMEAAAHLMAQVRCCGTTVPTTHPPPPPPPPPHIRPQPCRAILTGTKLPYSVHLTHSPCPTHSSQASTTGNPRARYNRAVSLLLGAGVQADIPAAVAILEELGTTAPNTGDGVDANVMLIGLYSGTAGAPGQQKLDISMVMNVDKGFEAAGRIPASSRDEYINAQVSGAESILPNYL